MAKIILSVVIVLSILFIVTYEGQADKLKVGSATFSCTSLGVGENHGGMAQAISQYINTNCSTYYNFDFHYLYDAKHKQYIGTVCCVNN